MGQDISSQPLAIAHQPVKAAFSIGGAALLSALKHHNSYFAGALSLVFDPAVQVKLGFVELEGNDFGAFGADLQAFASIERKLGQQPLPGWLFTEIYPSFSSSHSSSVGIFSATTVCSCRSRQW